MLLISADYNKTLKDGTENKPSLWPHYGLSEARLQSGGEDLKPARFGTGQVKPGPQYAAHVKETYWSYLSVDSPKAPCSFFTAFLPYKQYSVL